MRCAALPHSRSHKVACPIIARYNAVVPGWVDTPTKCVPKVRPSLLATPSLQERTFGTHPGGEVPFPAQLPLYRVMISCTHFGVLQALPKQRHHHAPSAAYAAPPIGPIGPIGPITPIAPPKRCPHSTTAAQSRQSGRSAAVATALRKSIPRP